MQARTLLLFLTICSSSLCLAQNSLSNLLESADTLYQQDAYEQASEKVEQALQMLTTNQALTTPEAARAFELQGDLFRAQYDFAKAATSYEKALDLLILQEPESVTTGKLYNKMGLCAEFNRQFTQAQTYYEQALTILQKTLGDNHLAVANVLVNMGFVASVNTNHQQAAQLMEKALAIKIDTLGANSLEVGKLHINLGMEFSRALQYKKAFQQFDRGERLLYQLEGDDSPLMGSVYLNIGSVYMKQGDVGRGIVYAEKALRNFKKTQGPNHPYVGDALNNIGSCYQTMRQYDIALDYFQQALAIDLEQPQPDYYSLANIYYNIAVCHRANKSFALAEADYIKALDYYDRSLPENHPYWIETITQLGKCACLQTRYAEAEAYFAKAQAAFDAREENQANEIAHLRLQQAVCLQQQERREEALTQIEAGLTVLGFDSNTTQYEENEASQTLPRLLFHKGKLLFQQYEEQQNVALLEEASATFQQLSQLYDFLRRSYRAPASKAFLVEDLSEVFGTAIAVEQELYAKTGNNKHLEQGLAFAEKSKSVLLLDNVNLLTSAAIAGIPEIILNEQNALRADISFWESKEAATTDDSLQQIISDTLFQLKEAYNATLTSMENDFPDYYKLRYGAQQNINWTDLIDKNTALLEYFLGDSSLYIFVVEKNGLTILKQARSATLETQVENLRRSLSDPQLIIEQPDLARSLFVENSHALYQQLLEDALASLPENINRLLLIPDGLLGYIPFEVLLQEKPTADTPFGKMAYLLRTYSVQYAYSGQLLFEQQKLDQRSASKFFAGFAPRYDRSDFMAQDTMTANNQLSQLVRAGALPLPGAKQEVETVARLLQGEVFVGEAASETIFKQQASDYKILHLSMHTLLDDTQPLTSQLLFMPDSLNDGQLTMAELYAMRLSANLAVLSACNTGYGEIRKGEGIMSLSRAFTYAGVPSTVMSLWKVPDEATAQIMVNFYQALEKGQPKDLALRTAKLDYLDNLLAPELGHPYYWAGFISAGDVAPVRAKTQLWWLLGIAALVCGLAFWYWREMRKE